MRFLFWRKPAVKSAQAERDEWLRWLELSGMSPATVDGYKRTTERFLREYPDVAFADFTDEQIQGFVEDANPRSRQSRRAPFVNWFAWGYRTKRIPHNPMHHVPTYKVPVRPAIDVFSEAERKIMCALPEPDGTLMALLLGTGLRKAEARNLTVRRVDLDHAEIHVLEGAKGGHPRIVPIGAQLVSRLAGYILVEGLSEADFFWPIRPGGGSIVLHDRPITNASMQTWWRESLAKAGVAYRKLHTTRHSYATEWRRRGLVMDDVAVLLGHIDTKTTKAVYDHTTYMDVRRRMEALDA